MNMKKNAVATMPVVMDATTTPFVMRRKVVATPQSPRMMPEVPSFRRNLRPLRSTIAHATTVMNTLTSLIARSEKLANTPSMPVALKMSTV